MIINFNEIISNGYKFNGIFHIGAHYGQEVNMYIQKNIPCILFEPNPDSYNILEQNFRGVSGVCTENYALGSKNEKRIMYCEKNNQGMSSSLLRPKKHLDYYPSISFDSMCNVDQITLDGYVENNNINLTIFNSIVMDVQGYELEVLKGSTKTLNRIDHILTEVNFEHMYENCALIEELDNFLKNYGFVRLGTVDSGCGWGDAFYSKNRQFSFSDHLRNRLLSSKNNFTISSQMI